MKYLFFVFLTVGSSINLLAQFEATATNQDTSVNALHETSFPTATMVKVKPKQISEGLKMTLQNVGYIGWEKGQLYFDKSRNEYALLLPSQYPDKKVLVEGSGHTADESQTWHFFTYEGRPFSINQ